MHNAMEMFNARSDGWQGKDPFVNCRNRERRRNVAMIKDPFAAYMTNTPEIVYHDCPIRELTLKELSAFADETGCFRKSFDVTLTGNEQFEEISVISTTAKYESEGDQIPAVQIRIIDQKGDTLYYTPVYEIGSKREYRRREWRLPPVFGRYQIVRVSFIIPEGVRLSLRDVRVKRNCGYREPDFGIRYHGHGGCTSEFGFQMTAEVGFTSCITIPKFTKDGIGVCFHDDASVIKEACFDDGSFIEEGSPLDKPVSEYTYDELQQLCVWMRKSDIFTGMRVPMLEDYFRICSMTGMQPIFSVHPELTKEQWIYVRRFLEKYRLLEQFRVKSGSINTHKICLEVFGDEIAGHITIFGAKTQNSTDPAEFAEAVGFDRSRHEVVVEYFNHVVTEELITRARQEGFPVSIAAMKGGASGPHMCKLMDLGVSEFTLDHHCSMGLDW